MQAEVGQLDINFKENSMTAHIWTIFMTIAVWATKKNHQKPSNCKPGKISDCHCLPSLWLKMLWAWHLQIFTAAFRTQKLGLHYAPVMNICIFLFFCFHVLVAQSCLTLCDPAGCSLPGSSVHGILQARILEWVAIPFSEGSAWPSDWTWVFCIWGRFCTLWATREVYLFP